MMWWRRGEKKEKEPRREQNTHQEATYQRSFYRYDEKHMCANAVEDWTGSTRNGRKPAIKTVQK